MWPEDIHCSYHAQNGPSSLVPLIWSLYGEKGPSIAGITPADGLFALKRDQTKGTISIRATWKRMMDASKSALWNLREAAADWQRA